MRIKAFALAVFFLWVAPAAAQPEPGGIETGIEGEIETHIVDVLEPEAPGDKTLVLLSSHGRVLRLEEGSLDTVDRELCENAVGTERRFRIKVSDEGDHDVIHDIVEIEPGPLPDFLTPGDVPSDAETSAIPRESPLHPEEVFDFLYSKHLRRDAECFHRAYLWGHDLWTQRDVFSYKVFLWFTEKYIREYNYYWWFHVAPYVVWEGDDYMVDATYTRGPLDMRTWTDVFMRNDAYCPTIDAYYGYSRHHRSRYCYKRLTTMYYYHPNRVRRADSGGYEIREWDRAGLRNSRQARP